MKKLSLRLAGAQRKSARIFNISFIGFCATVAACFVFGLSALYVRGNLPAPPLSGTACIDEKFMFLHNADLTGVNLIAVGSSVTWRNLNFATVTKPHPNLRPINAAPCYLYIDQTAYLSKFLIERMPDVGTLITVVAPRDFEQCNEADTAFFKIDEAERYVFKKRPSPLLYVTNFSLVRFAKEARHIAKERQSDSLTMDEFGSGPMRRPFSWQPPPKFDMRCFDALEHLMAHAERHGVTLILVTAPTMPEWAARFDPTGSLRRAFKERIRHAFLRGNVTVIDGDEYGPLTDDDFADAVHLLWQSTSGFTKFIFAKTTSAGVALKQ